ncbi:MAG: YIP1 family protein [Candidatus Micrarchaeia archaeon]
MIKEQLKEGFDIIMHPTNASYKNRDIKEMLIFYYMLSIVPLIIFVAISFAEMNINGLLIGIASILVISPIGFFISALLYHAFGKLFKFFKKSYQDTFAATIYGSIPSIIFVWLSATQITSYLLIIFGIWSFIVTVFALANKQNTTPLKAFAVILTTIIVIIIIMFAILIPTLLELGVFNSANLIKSTCLATPGYMCQNLSISPTGKLSIIFGQSEGFTMYNFSAYVIPINQTNNYGGIIANNMPLSSVGIGDTIPLSFNLGSAYLANRSFFGSVWIRYSKTPGGAMNSSEVAEIVINS